MNWANFTKEIEEVMRDFLNENSELPNYIDGSFYSDNNECFHSTSNCEVRSGASKIVLLPYDGELSDWVLKIPIIGETWDDELSCCKNCKKWQEYVNGDKSYDPCEDCGEEEYEYNHAEYTGARFASDHSNYCETEFFFSVSAIEEGLDEVFLPVEYIGCFYGFPVYAQRRVSNQHSPIEASQNSKARYQELMDMQEYECLNVIGSTLGGALIEGYGEEKMLEILRFICNHEINDLHGGNYTRIDGKIVFFDYSGFRN